ncbi:MAG: transposase [Candidatus Obscuribacterales bacterium]|nr:transposase [Candidatus Obscuribacterales bacterium]
MCLKPARWFEISRETRKVAEKSFQSKPTIAMKLAGELGSIFVDEDFCDLFSRKGKLTESPSCLAIVTLLQFAEGLTDRQTEEAICGRIDWSYALALPLDEDGIDQTVLSEFRSRLLKGNAEERLLNMLLEKLRGKGLLRERGRQRTDSIHVVAAVCALNRLERVGETMRAVLSGLATVTPDWVQAIAKDEW